MDKYHDVLQTTTGDIVTSTNVTVRVSGGSVATIYEDDEVTTITQPLSTDTEGNISFKAANGAYDIYVDGVLEKDKIVLFDPGDSTALSDLGISSYAQTILDDADAPAAQITLKANGVIDTLTNLKAETNITNGRAIFLTDSSRGDEFVFSNADLSTEVTADTQNGIYVPPNSDTTGASGAWVRNYSGYAKDIWFGSGNSFIDANVSLSIGQVLDRYSGANIHRFADRIIVGEAADNAAGTSDKTDGASLIGDPSGNINSFYLESGATFISASAFGAVGGTFGSKKSLRYSVFNGSVWTSGESITTGDIRGYAGKIYEATTTGTTGSTPPTHTSGTASDGGVTWQFNEYAYGTSIGLAAVVDNDITDGQGAWAGYIEMVRGSSGGTGYGFEIVAKNKGSDITNTPYNEQPAGSTIGIFLPGGGDSTLGAPANPSTSALVIYKNAETWNKGIVFGHDAIEGSDGSTGNGIAISFAKGHEIEWQASDGRSSVITSNVSSTNNKVGMKFEDDKIVFTGFGGNIIEQIENTSSSVNYIRIQSAVTGNGPNILAGGSDTNIDLLLSTKGTGVLQFGTHAAITTETLSGYITIKDSGGTSRKVAIVS